MMQTLYYTTHNFVRRSGNVIDLCEYRSRMQDVQEEPVSAAPAADRAHTPPPSPPERLCPADGQLCQHERDSDDPDFHLLGAGQTVRLRPWGKRATMTAAAGHRRPGANRIDREELDSMKEAIHTDRAPRRHRAPIPRPSGPEGSCSPLGRFRWTPLPGDIPAGIKAQAQQSLNNIAAILAQAGLDRSAVVKTTVFLKDMNDFAATNEGCAPSSLRAPPSARPGGGGGPVCPRNGWGGARPGARVEGTKCAGKALWRPGGPARRGPGGPGRLCPPPAPPPRRAGAGAAGGATGPPPPGPAAAAPPRRREGGGVGRKPNPI